MFGDQTLPLSFAITKRSGVVKLLSKYGQSLSFFFSHPLKLFLSFLFYFDWHFGFPILFLLLNMCHAHAFLLVFWPYFSCMSLDSVHIPKSCDCQFSLSLSLSLSHGLLQDLFEEGHLIAQNSPQLTSSRYFFCLAF
jgi:hypothetical protein